VISYLRTQQPVRHAVAPSEFNALGKVVKAFVLEPKGPSAPIAAEAPRGPTVENMEHDAFGDPTKKFIPPNLTPDPRWGWIATWPEDVFVARMKLGKQREGTPMPWHGVKRLAEDDLRAVYRDLRTVPPAQGGPDPSVTDAVVALKH
jgi:hypothetical protein